MAEELNPTGYSVERQSGRSTADDIRQLAEAGKQLFEAGKRITDSLNELTQRVEYATKISSRVVKSPWILAIAAVVAGAVMLTLAHRRTT